MTAITNIQSSCEYCSHLIESPDTHIFEKCQHIFHKACIEQEPSICPTCNPECAICKELTTEDSKTTLKCGHIFHTTCRDTWIEQQLLQNNEPTCSTCRSVLENTTIFNVSSNELLIKMVTDYYTKIVFKVKPELLIQNPKLMETHINLIISLISRTEHPEVLSYDFIEKTFLQTIKLSSSAPQEIASANHKRPYVSNEFFAVVIFLTAIFGLYEMYFNSLEKS